MRRILPILPLLLALFFSVTPTLLATESAAAQGFRLREVGGYGLLLRDTPTFAYGSLDSATNGQAKKGEIVYINGWQIGVYHVGDNRWIASSAVQPIVDVGGRPMANYVTQNGNQYYMNGQAITLPGRHMTQVERFLRNPDIAGTVIYRDTFVPMNLNTEIMDASTVWYSTREPVVATMRVTGAYNFIYLRTEPRDDAPKASTFAYAHEILTAYEVVDNRWYRIGPNLWAPASFGGETLMSPENAAAYAPQEYYNGGKWISIDLKRQQMTAWEGNDVVMATRIKSGKYGYATPTGTWKIYDKQANARMAGNDYDLLDVAWTQYFTPSRVAIHSAYWHNNYNGRPGSHGCVNTPTEVAKKLFMWSPMGTTVVTHNAYVYDQTDIRDAQKWSQYER
ncbi:MAG: L,D-transpeptidase [Ardenticatenales bacterium]|nr:L,D-transpeptidase [Ardenticatenales bacterium]